MQEFLRYILSIAEITKKIKIEVQIDSFSEIIEKLNSVLEHIPGKKYIFSKILILSEMLTTSTIFVIYFKSYSKFMKKALF